jgi:hypothetical protein
MVNKKGELQIQETILVIFVFFIILMIGMVLFFQFSMKSARDEIEEYEEFRFKQLIDVVPNLPEIRYSRFGIEDVWCIDLLKARSFSQISDRYDFGFKKMVIHSSTEIVLYDNPSQRGEVRKVTTPVCLYDARQGKFYLAQLEVDWWT